MVGIAIGVGGVWLVYIGVSALVGLPSPRWQEPHPAVGLRGAGDAAPGRLPDLPNDLDVHHELHVQPARTAIPLDPLQVVFSTRQYIAIFKNNIIWLVVGTAGSVGLGLLIAGLVDRVRREALAKTFIFLPLAISLVGASVIWRFVYAWQPRAGAVRPSERDLDWHRLRSRAVDRDASRSTPTC